jgi:hypothetical protein
MRVLRSRGVSVPFWTLRWLWRRFRYEGEVMCEEMSKVGLAVAERYVSSFCWFRRCEGQCVRRSVALQ